MASKRILLVDNRPEHMKQPVLRLQLEGYDVETASDGDEALSKLHADGFDLLLLDAELHGSDGWETLKKVRDDQTLSELKVIVFMAARGETGKLALLPVDAELRRPFPMGELLEKVRKVLSS